MTFISFLLSLILANNLQASDALWEQFLAKDQKVQNAIHQKNKTDFQIKEVRASFMPNISLDYTLNASKTVFVTGSTQLEFENRIHSAAVSLRQPIYLGGRLFASLRYAKLQKQIEDNKVLIAKIEAKREFIALISTIYSLREKLKLQKESLSFQERFSKVMRKKQRIGNARLYELDKALSDLLSRQSIVKQLETQLDTAENDLKSRLETNTLESIRLPDTKVDTNASFENLMKNNPSINNILLGLESLKESHTVSNSEDNLQVSLSANKGIQDDKLGDLPEGDESYSIVLAASLPLFSGLSSLHKKDAQNSEVKSFENQKKDLMDRLKTQFTATKSLLKTNQLLLEFSSRQMKLAKKAFEKGNKSYKNGQIKFFELLQLQQGYELSVNNNVDLLTQTATAKNDYLGLLGRL
ncbi:MAG: TolC family protein [Bdellovibrionales bacterium]